MRNSRQIIWGILLILASSALLYGVIASSQAEGIIRLPTSTPVPPSTSTTRPSASQDATPTPVVYVCPTTVPVICPALASPTLPPPPTPPPTLTAPAISSPSAIATTIPTGSPTPTQTPSPTQTVTSAPTHTVLHCGAPRTWVIYIVQKGDTLYHLGQIYGVPYTEIQRANCLLNFNIRIGQILYVPPWAPIMSFPTFFFEPFEPTAASTFYLPFETPITETPTAGSDFPTDFPTPTDTIPTP